MAIFPPTRNMTTRFGIAALALFAAAPAALAAQAVAVPAPPPAPPVAAPSATAVLSSSPLAQIPGVTVRHYDVTGTTMNEIRASIASQRPRDPATGEATPSSSTWRIGARVQKATTGDQCRVAGAEATFQAQVELPRLVNAESVPAPVLAEWQAYLTSVEQNLADQLRQPAQRVSEVEQAMLASTCEGAREAAGQAISRITAAPAAPAPRR